MSLFHAHFSRRYSTALCAYAVLWAAAGCGGNATSKLLQVSGKVTVGGKPLTTGTGSVSFRPIASTGNKTTQEPAGMIYEDGTYQLFTGGKLGAPPGRYRVLVVDMDPVDPKNPYNPKRKSHVNLKYGDPKSSDVVIEVVQNPAPGAYDLNLSK